MAAGALADVVARQHVVARGLDAVALQATACACVGAAVHRDHWEARARASELLRFLRTDARERAHLGDAGAVELACHVIGELAGAGAARTGVEHRQRACHVSDRPPWGCSNARSRRASGFRTRARLTRCARAWT